MSGSAEELRARAGRAGRRILEARAAIERGRPWPLGTVEPDAPEATWGPPEILAHLAEMLSFWIGELERIIESAETGRPTTAGLAAGEPVPFGRTQNDRIRVLTIARDRTLPVDELLTRISGGLAGWQMRLVILDEGDLARRGLHPSLGEMTAGELVERFVVAHLEEHAEQLEAALRRPGA